MRHGSIKRVYQHGIIKRVYQTCLSSTCLPCHMEPSNGWVCNSWVCNSWVCNSCNALTNSWSAITSMHLPPNALAILGLGVLYKRLLSKAVVCPSRSAFCSVVGHEVSTPSSSVAGHEASTASSSVAGHEASTARAPHDDPNCDTQNDMTLSLPVSWGQLGNVTVPLACLWSEV